MHFCGVCFFAFIAIILSFSGLASFSLGENLFYTINKTLY